MARDSEVGLHGVPGRGQRVGQPVQSCKQKVDVGISGLLRCIISASWNDRRSASYLF